MDEHDRSTVGADGARSTGAEEPEGPTQLPGRSWWAIVRRSVREARDDGLTDWAAALTYYAVLSLFPALIVFVAVIGLFGSYPRTSDALLDIVGQLGPSSAVETFRAPITSVVRDQGGAGALLGVGLLGALWTASGYVGAFMRAANAIYEVEEGRPFWKLRPLQLGVTILMVLGAAVVAIAVVMTGSVARAIGDAIGVGHGAVTVWNIAKWPVLALIVMTMFAVLYYVAPNVRLPAFRWLTPGGALALVVWLVASGLFALYAANFSSYNKTYGALGGVVIFLVWMWLTNLSILIGAELNVEVERQRELELGLREAEHEIQLPPRNAPEPTRALPQSASRSRR